VLLLDWPMARIHPLSRTARFLKFCSSRATSDNYSAQIAVAQSISGTGALRIGGAFFERHFPGPKAIYLPTPTWGNHIPIFKDSGLEVRRYRYFTAGEGVGLDWAGAVEDLKASTMMQMMNVYANITAECREWGNCPSSCLRTQSVSHLVPS
jgi:aspartate/tyrosine/aromatic aminotransferase